MSQVKDLVDAIDAFVKGTKADGTWNAVKASCIMAGWDNLNGALTPLVGEAPTNFNFVSGDYNRNTGLVGDGSTKYLDSNRNNNADPQNSKHISVYATSANTGSTNRAYIGAGLTAAGAFHFFRDGAVVSLVARSNQSTTFVFSGLGNSTGFIACNRSSSSLSTARAGSADVTSTLASETPLNQNIIVFGRNLTASANARLAFYSIGESLDLAQLDTRVTSLINAIDAAIP
jgi:hypothetical protein